MLCMTIRVDEKYTNKQTSVSIQFCQSLFSVKGHVSIFIWFFLGVLIEMNNASDVECQTKIR